jgi:hypothetical protein
MDRNPSGRPENRSRIFCKPFGRADGALRYGTTPRPLYGTDEYRLAAASPAPGSGSASREMWPASLPSLASRQRDGQPKLHPYFLVDVRSAGPKLSLITSEEVRPLWRAMPCRIANSNPDAAHAGSQSTASRGKPWARNFSQRAARDSGVPNPVSKGIRPAESVNLSEASCLAAPPPAGANSDKA